MNYSFFLFGKLYELYFPNDEPYDTFFDKLVIEYEKFKVWDKQEEISEHDAMCNYLQTLNN